MERALVVEDTEKWQNFHRGALEPILGERNVDVVDNYDDALSMLDRDYNAYILDVQFPRHRLGRPQLLGVQLAQEIIRREGSYAKIVVVSSHMSLEAQNLGITRIYSKYSLGADKNEVAIFLRDLRSLFNLIYKETLTKMGKLFILCGLAFSGKTSLAQRIAECLPVTIISFDEIYEELRQKTGGDLSAQPEIWDQVKRIALLSLSENLQEGRNVVWDSTNPLRKHREELIGIGDCFGAQSIVVHLNTPLDEIRRRRQRNKFTNERSDRGSEEFEQRLRIWEDPLEGEHAIQITSEANVLTFIHTPDIREATNEIGLNMRRSKER